MTSVRRRPSSCTRLVALAVLLVGASAHAAPPAPRDAATPSAAPEDADSHFHRGVDLYKDNDYSGALVEFRRAYALDPKYQVLYNIGETLFQLQDFASALKTFQQYLYEGGNKIGPKRRRDVDRDIEKLRRRVAVVTIDVKERGATIAVDDLPVGTTPLGEPILVSAGRRKITATLPGRPPVTQIVEVAGGESPTVSLVIPAAEVKVVTLERPSLAPPIIAWGATGAVLTGAVITGVLALGASSDLKQKLATFPGDPQAIASAHAKTAGLALATDILGATALAGAGVSIWLTTKVQRATPKTVDSSPPPPAPSARVFVTPTGLGVAGAF